MATKPLKRDFKRRNPTLTLAPTVLIVCEGTKTEPNYFNALKHDLGLTSVVIDMNCPGSDPQTVTDYAVNLCKKADGGYEYVFCVIDRDNHPLQRFNQALAAAERLGKSGKIKALIAWSEPCFEYWILLHYCYTSTPYSAYGSKTIADSCTNSLRIYLKDYEKNHPSLYQTIKANTKTAIEHAQRRLRECEADGKTNPSTRVHWVVEQLLKIADAANPR